MTRRRLVYTILALVFCALYWGCGQSTNYAGGSEVVGKTVAKSGSAVPNATVTALKQDGETYDSVAVATSDSKGQFKFTNLDTGNYKLFGIAVQSDTLVGLKEGIVVSGLSPKGEPPVRVDAGALELRPKGWILGTVVLDKDDMSGVLCYTRDSAFIAVSREDGSYTIPRVAEGTYTVCFFYMGGGYLPAFVDNIVVVSGEGTEVPPVLLKIDPDGAPNKPRSLTAAYDTVHGIVHLRWRSVPVEDLQEYIVYRKNEGDAGEPLPIDTIVNDTVAIDTVFSDLADTLSKSLVYQIKAVDSANNQSPFSDPATVLAVPPYTIRPVVRSISADTIVAYGGTVRCRIGFLKAFNEFQVFMAFDGNGPDYSWIEVPHSSEGIADTLFSTGDRSVWGKVAMRINFYKDSIDTFFTVRIRPRSVPIVSADSTDSTITIRWNRSPDSDFREYALHRNAGADSVLFQSTQPADTVYTFSTLSTAPAGFWVAVADTEGVVSEYDSNTVAFLRIVNSPPRFVTTPDSLPDSTLVGEEYSVTLTATDRNSDTLVFVLQSPAAAAMNENILTWTPGINQIGAQRCTVTVRDNNGGEDTLAWRVCVVAHGIWASGDSLIGARRQCGVVALDGVVYAIGGSVNRINSNQPMALKTVEAYDTLTRTWSEKAPLANARWAPFITAWDGKIYVLGGFSDRSYSITSIEVYDPAVNTWTTMGQMPFARAHGASCLVGSRLYCIGGRAYDAALRSEVIVKTIDIFDLSAQAWSKGPDMLNSRADHQVVAGTRGIYIVGGYGGAADSIAMINNEEQMVSVVEICDTAQNQCVASGATLSTPRCNFAIAFQGSTVYCIGGFRSLMVEDNNILSGVETLDVSTMQRGSTVPLPEPRHSAAGIALNNAVYCIGGVLEESTTRSVVIFYP
jgi:hypothetical protein